MAGNIGGEIEAPDNDDFAHGRGLGGGQYRPVFAHDNDRAVLEMSSIEPGVHASSSSRTDLKKVKVGVPSNVSSDGSPPDHGGVNMSQTESKLELFGFDSLVNILGLKSMAGDQILAPSSPSDGDDASLERARANSLKLGTMMGVFVPCVQNILGIIYYIKFTWIVGMAGIGQSLMLVAFCGSCTLLTTISLSAIDTNGAMKVGVSISLLFFLGNVVAGSLYVLCAVETFLDVVPQARIFRDARTLVKTPNGTDVAQPITSPSLHDMQIYGIIVTIILCFIVFGRVKIINRVAPAFLIPILFSLFCIFIGIALARRLPWEIGCA